MCIYLHVVYMKTLSVHIQRCMQNLCVHVCVYARVCVYLEFPNLSTIDTLD